MRDKPIIINQEPIYDFSEVLDKSSMFVNGEFSVQRTKEWFKAYKNHIYTLVGACGEKPGSYVWYRRLDDGNSKYYALACRILCVCPKCFKEWGQPFYAKTCNHKDINYEY
jgi:hypothetical protein